MLSLTTFFSAILLGSMVFFSGVSAPAIHRSLEPAHSQTVTRSLFPRYFLWGAINSALALLFAILSKSTLAIPLGIVLVGFLYSRQILMPKVTKAKDLWMASDSAQDKARYKSLHKRSVIINAAQIFLLLGVVVANQFFYPH